MMTSRAEYRLILRQDNADLRLTELGRQIGLVSDERYQRFLNKKSEIQREFERLKSTNINPSQEVNQYLQSLESAEIKSGISLYDIIRRPEISYKNLTNLDKNRPELNPQVLEQVEIQIKYEGYIERQLRQVEQFRKLEKKPLPRDIDYNSIKGLRLEAMQKLTSIKPSSVGQASRISGVSPADISVLLVYLEQQRRLRGNRDE